ncbi:MAG: outer membrane protein insertion porin family [Blastocatellia bacterium]|jgi:outer membrane protein insertion porin family|nr:outer membrane protein insertion porin family [Blastocatellia bacterium]
MSFFRALCLVILSATIGTTILFTFTDRSQAQQPQQRLVESVDITGNRRLRKDDILYWIQTRAGDPYNAAQVERDLQTILGLNFFDKTSTRVLIEDGPRGGVNVIFEVKELPIIRDLQFEGLHSVTESDVLKAFREKRVGVSKEAIYDPVKVRTAVRVLKELLAARGHPNAVIDPTTEEVSATSTAITFKIDEGERVRVVEIAFEGNKIFSDGKLRSQMKYVQEAGLMTRFKGQDILDRDKLDYDLHNVDNYMRSKGYLQARHGEPRVESVGPRRTGLPILPLPFLSSVDEGLRVTVPINEGKLYRIGELKIEGNSIFSEQVIRAIIGLKQGDVADGKRISDSLFKTLKEYYGGQGFIQYTSEPSPTFKENPQKPEEGIVDFVVTIDEGKQFTLRRLEFLGNTFTRDNVLRREVLMNEGDIYNQRYFEYSIIKLNQLGYFDPIDKDKDADLRTNEEEGLVDVNIKVVEKGRQQISFNGGISGIGGSFFGLDYSTNNLFGRGEVLALQLAAGNRQKTFQFSFTEPYVKNRPITAGISVFASKQKFFGEGTSLSQNTEAQQGFFGSTLDFLNASEENLFTRTTYGGSIFASAPLSEFYRKRPFTQFSRVGLSYQISQSSTKQPPVNAANNPTTFIPELYTQPSILTSRATASFIYDTRNGSIDPTRGRELSVALAAAGLAGDVRTIQPTGSYIQYIPVRNKNSDKPQVFGFRLLAGTVTSFATSSKIKNASSLAFVDGVPIFERFWLGGEDTIRGYNVRSISPRAPLDTYFTSRNVVLATNDIGDPVVVTGLPANLASVGLFTGASGNNQARLPRAFTPIGADTQLLGNFEYRIPLFGPVSVAAFADVGTAFNLWTKGDQIINSNFLPDQPFFQTVGRTVCPRAPGSTLAVTLSTLVACNNGTDLALTNFGGLAIRDNRFASRAELDEALRLGPVDPVTLLPIGFQQVFLRGEAQTNTVVKLGESLFSKFGDFHASVGAEVRFQIPVVNVPFRLIFAYNPRARKNDFFEGFPIFFNEKKFVPRFSVGRTF